MTAQRSLLWGGLLMLAAFIAPSPSQAQCYPGLPCPGGQTAPADRASPTETPRGSFGENYHYVGAVLPPDPWLALRSEPSSTSGHRIMKMPEGTLLRQLERRGVWWYVELTTGERGWAHSKWIKCCKKAGE